MIQSLEKNESTSVCLVHDWLVGMRGGEKVLEALVDLYPKAPIYTLFANKKQISEKLRCRTIHTSFLQWIPGIFRFYRWLLPIFPFAITTLNVKQYDLVISVSHSIAKAVKRRKDATHVCYCNSPVRYAWDFSEEYFRHHPAPLRWIITHYCQWLKKWDRATASRVDHFIGNSQNIRNKIERCFGRSADVVYPPVDVVKMEFATKRNYYLYVGALVPYKRPDLAIEACKRLNLSLKIVGDGPMRAQLEAQAQSGRMRFEGWVNDALLVAAYKGARALLFPGDEDFGIVPVEAQMFAVPVIAYGKGGALETVVAPQDASSHKKQKATGIFFYEQNVEALMSAIKLCDKIHFDPQFAQSHVQKFRRERFMEEMKCKITTYPK